MSGTSTTSEHSSPSSTVSRTLAIISAAGLPHRFEIESRIASSGFEVVKERQIALHLDDPSVHELFGEEAAGLCGEPVWVYVLERRRAVEVWKALMGDIDPDLARISSPQSLRAKYGKTIKDNAVYGSPNTDMAELQMNSIFISSPPLPSIDSGRGLDDIPAAHLALPDSSRSTTSGSSVNFSGDTTVRVDIRSKTQGFKARPVPPTTASPSIQPRMSRAAALRAGVDLGPTQRHVATKESIAKTFENVPGHKRATSISVASTAPPVVAPRPNRAMALRLQGEINDGGRRKPPTEARTPTTPERTREIFENVPGHKRRESFSVASTAPPTIAPRPTRASALRTGEISPPALKPFPSKDNGRPKTAEGDDQPSLRGRMSFDNVPGHKRNLSIEVPSVRPPSTTPRINRSAALREAHKKNGGVAPPSSFFMKSVANNDDFPSPTLNAAVSTPGRRSSFSLNRAPSQASVRLTVPSAEPSYSGRSASVDGRPSENTSPATIPRPPSIPPKPNRASLLRAKMGSVTPAVRKVFAF